MRHNRNEYQFHTDYEPEYVAPVVEQERGLTIKRVFAMLIVVLIACFFLGEYILH